MRRIMVIASLLVSLTFCLHTDAADAPKLTIVLDQAKLTKWVLEEFPDGLPFDRTGKPTDPSAAAKFWQLLADWPIQVSGEVTDVRAAIEQISDETGLPIAYGEDALARIEAAEKKMRMVTISDSVLKAVKIISMQAGVEQMFAFPLGLVIVGPDEKGDKHELHGSPPTNTFRWRANYDKLVEKAVGEDWDPETATDDDYRKLMKIATSIRCDLIVAEPMTLGDFLNWVAAASKQTIVIDFAEPELTDDGAAKSDPRFLGPPIRVGDDDKKPATVGPVVCYFAPFLDAVNTALDGTGIELVATETCFRVLPAKPKNTFLWREDYWAEIKKRFLGRWPQAVGADEDLRGAAVVAGESLTQLADDR
jgi:hypothetical protein